MKNESKEQGPFFLHGPRLKDDGSALKGAVRKALAEHQRLLKGAVQRTKALGGRYANKLAGKRITELEDGTVITTWVNPFGLQPILQAHVQLPAIGGEIETLECLLGFTYAKAGEAFYLELDGTENEVLYETGNRTWYSASSELFLSWDGGTNNFRYKAESGGGNIYHAGQLVATAPVNVYGVGFNSAEGLLYVATLEFYGLYAHTVAVYKASASLNECEFTVVDDWELVGSTDWPTWDDRTTVTTIMPFNSSGTSLTFCTARFLRCKDIVEIAITPTTLTPTLTAASSFARISNDIMARDVSDGIKNWSATPAPGCVYTYDYELDFTTTTWAILTDGTNPGKAYNYSDYINDVLVYAYVTGEARTNTYGEEYTATYDPAATTYPVGTGSGWANNPYTGCPTVLQFSSETQLPSIQLNGGGPEILTANYTILGIPAVYPFSGNTVSLDSITGKTTYLKFGDSQLELLDLRERFYLFKEVRETYTADGNIVTIDKATETAYVIHKDGVDVRIVANEVADVTMNYGGGIGEYRIPTFTVPQDIAYPYPCPDEACGGSGSCPFSGVWERNRGTQYCSAVSTYCAIPTVMTLWDYAGIPQKNSHILVGSYSDSGTLERYKNVTLNGVEVEIDGIIQDPEVLGSVSAFQE